MDVYVYAHVYVYVYVYVSLYAYVYVSLYEYVHVYVYMYMYVRMFMCIFLHVHVGFLCISVDSFVFAEGSSLSAILHAREVMKGKQWATKGKQNLKDTSGETAARSETAKGSNCSIKRQGELCKFQW